MLLTLSSSLILVLTTYFYTFFIALKILLVIILKYHFNSCVFIASAKCINYISGSNRFFPLSTLQQYYVEIFLVIKWHEKKKVYKTYTYRFSLWISIRNVISASFYWPWLEIKREYDRFHSKSNSRKKYSLRRTRIHVDTSVKNEQKKWGKLYKICKVIHMYMYDIRDSWFCKSSDTCYIKQ